MKIPLIKPYINQKIKDKVCEVLDSGYLTEGPVTKEFEEAFRSYIGCKHAIAVTSCTTGLEMALRVLGIGSGDEVIVPDYTYPATASTVAIVGAKAVLVDISKETMLIDYDALEKAITKRTKAIIPVSGFGNPLDYTILNQIKKKYNIYIIEDAACSLGAKYKNIKVGNHCDISVFSLHPRKFITTGEGGMITTNNSSWAEWMNSYKHFGMNMSNTNREGVQFEIIGTNYKLSNILAAVGLGQLQIINDLLKRRIELADYYNKLLKNINGIEIPKTTGKGEHSYQSYCIYVDKPDEIIPLMRAKGIEVQIGTYSLHLHNAFKNNTNNVLWSGNFENSEWAFNHCLTLPLYHDLTFSEQEQVVILLQQTMKSLKLS